MRDECIDCIFNGELMVCAALELKWAWYNMLLELGVPRWMYRTPPPCWEREAKNEESEPPKEE